MPPPPAARTWTRFTSGAVSEPPSLARVKSGALHLAWREGSHLLHTTIAVDGKPGVQTTAAGSSQSAPWLVAHPDGCVLQVTYFDQGSLQVGPSGDSGASWTATPYPGAQPGAIIAVTPDKGGKPVMISADKGQIKLHGATAPEKVQESPCCVNRLALALDPESAEGWAAWHEISPKAAGLFAKAIKPLAGMAQLAPGSSPLQPTQRLALAARIGVPGVYLAYLAGPPSVREVKLWNVRGGEALTVAKAPGARLVWLAPAPDGRLWILWMNPNGTVSTVRGSKALTRFSRPYTLTGPAPAPGAPSFLTADGGAGPLDVLVGAFHLRLYPNLEVSTSPRGVLVSDLGEPVEGVEVEIEGKKNKTDIKGLAAHPISAGTPPPPVKATHPGYAPATMLAVAGPR